MKAIPKLSIHPLAMAKLRLWAQLANGEVSCLAEVTDQFYVQEVYLLEQFCTSASTELSQEAIAKLMLQVKEPGLLRGWFHSHGDLRVFWSSTDESTVELLKNSSFLVSMVINRYGDLLTRIDFFRPLRVTLENLPLEVRYEQLLDKETESGAFHRLVQHYEPAMSYFGPGGRFNHDQLPFGGRSRVRLPVQRSSRPTKDDELEEEVLRDWRPSR